LRRSCGRATYIVPEDWAELLLPEIERQQRLGKEVVFRADAAFAKPEIYEARVGAHGTLCRAVSPAKETIHALESLNRYIVWGCWEPKRKFRITTLRIGESQRKKRRQMMRRKLFILVVGLAVAVLPAAAQTLLATVPVGIVPGYLVFNPVTNKIYVENICGTDPTCSSPGSITVIDGATNQTTNIPVGNNPQFMVMNPASNKLYVTNRADGTVSVINGATNQVIKILTVGAHPVGADVNPLTNRIYIANYGNRKGNTVSVIDGNADQVIATITVQYAPIMAAVDSVTNKIYVANRCATDPNDCYTDGSGISGSLSVIDGTTDAVTNTLGLDKWPSVMIVNPVTNKIYVGNSCGTDPTCIANGNANTIGTITVVDGATLTTSTVTAGHGTTGMTVNPVANEVYMTNGTDNTVIFINGVTLNTTTLAVGTAPADVEVNPDTYKIYVTNNGDNTLTTIDGVSHGKNTLGVGGGPASAVVNPVTNRIYIVNSNDNTVSVVAGASSDAAQFVPVTPCRVVDTRNPNGPFGGPPISGGTYRDFPIPAGACDIPSTATGYSFNVTLVPVQSAPVGYLTIWPTGELQPLVSTMNSLDGRIKANAAIVQAGAAGAVRVYASNTTHVVLDIDGYFEAPSGQTLQFYPLTPCRVLDTRNPNGPLGGPFLADGQERDFPVLSSNCEIPSSAQAYSMNFTVVPYQGQSLGYLTVWAQGQSKPVVSTLNNLTATIVANAAIVPAGTGGGIAAYPSGNTQLVADIDGYFAPAGSGGLSLYPVAPCRVIDTRKGSGAFSGELTVDVVDSACAPPSTAQAYVFNATVVPVGSLGYLTLWPDGESQPVVSTLNAIDGAITSNMAIVPNLDGSTDAYASGTTQLILDISSYFAP
jgi:YVTN family beta-propeller protein